MRPPQNTLSSDDVREYSQELVRRHLRLSDYTAIITFERVLTVLLYVAVVGTTVAAACRRLRGAPCDQSVYDALQATLPERLELQRRINRALAQSVPKSIRRGKRKATVAIDLTLLPYYGRPDPSDDMVYKGQEKASTKHHHAYATAYLVRKGRRFTLAVRAVRHDEPWEETVRELLRQARKLVPAIGLVLLDRGFYCVAVIRYLQAARTPFVMPVIARGRPVKHPKGPSGTTAFLTWKKSGWAEYTLTEKHGGRKARVAIAVKVRRTVPPRRGGGQSRRVGKVLVYACWGLSRRDPHRIDQAYQSRWVEWVRQTYRGRFGIETSYRQMNQGRGWTTSRCPRRRLLLVGLALLLRNVWALVHLKALAQRGRGGPRLRLHLLPLADLLDWIKLALERELGVRERLEVEHSFTL